MPSKQSTKKSVVPPQPMSDTAPLASVSEAADPFSEFRASAHTPRTANVSKKSLFGGVLVIVILSLLAGVLGYALNTRSLFFQKKQTVFHAVFLNSGQVYFGVIKEENRDTLVLANVFYVQMTDQEIPSEKEGEAPRTIQVPKLVQKGEEFYAPSNTIRINKSQVTVIEDLTEGSKVLQDIRSRLKQ